MELVKKPFSVKLILDKDYYRLHITHPSFKGRIRKRLGNNKSREEFENIAFTLKFEIQKFFSDKKNIDRNEAEAFIDHYVALNVKNTASLFEYKVDFLNYLEKEKINKQTRKNLTKSTISCFKTALNYFENYLIKERKSQHPSTINEDVLDKFYLFLKGEHNYKVKLHAKVKSFIKYIHESKLIPVDPTYHKSKFNEEYDNQCPDADDIAVSEADMLKLIALRKKIQNGEIEFKIEKYSGKFSREVQDKQFKKKNENLVKSLDCFLFMSCTGMYFADILKSKVNISGYGNDHTLSYRRSKSNSLCKAIPVKNNGIFIIKELIEQYGIKNGSNFPIKISDTHFLKHLKRISQLAELDIILKSKMARKTFGSYLYFKKNMPIHLLQILMGHKDVKYTMHYLRVTDKELANEVTKWV